MAAVLSSRSDPFEQIGINAEASDVLRARRRERVWQWVAGFSLMIAALAVGAVVGLTPLKSVSPPVVLRVDNATGAVDVVSVMKQTQASYSEVIDKYWLSRYVGYRETYSDAMAFPNYKAVSLMSAGGVGEQYYRSINPDNPKSPVRVYGQNQQVDVSVDAITFLGANNVAQVRLTRTERAGAQTRAVTHWIATITYRYLASPLSEQERLINPLGFQVTDYRLDPENVSAQ